MLADIVLDTCKDTVRLLPFLFFTYLLMEYLEHKAGGATASAVKKSGRFGPLLGAVAGVIPQCGFSAAASSMYSGGVILVGTLLAIFLSTSDEMLPILLSEAVKVPAILKILLTKVVIGMVTGFFVDFLVRIWKAGKKKEIHDLCTHEHCHCEEGILKSALRHTLRIAVFIFVISFAIGLAVECVGEDAIAGLLLNRPVLGVLLAGLVGLIPNCASSVAITKLYLEGILGAGQMMAGLLVGAGVGLLVLFRTNQNMKENLKITGILYAAGVLWGLLIELAGVVY